VALRQQAGPRGEAIRFERADVQDETSVQALMQTLAEAQRSPDILINTVGGYAAGQPVTDLSLATWEHMLDLNLRSAFLLAKHAARPMVEQGWGRIVHVSSRSARSGRRNAAAYAVAKNGVVALAEIQAEELAGTGVNVNAILPSIIDTSANRAAMPSADHSRWPKPEEVARVLLFLASDDAGLISGASIPVYGRA
jgi:NAD(P)-dependent dehydrogenase (short-subunit alcohol dehydrogenase family)